jgi:hypothetical protein
MGNVASALVPLMVSSVGSSLRQDVISYGGETEWNVYLAKNNLHVLTDIFGSASVSPAVVTKLRVLIDQFKSTLQSMFYTDTDFSCKGASAFNPGNSFLVAFFGTLQNGSSSDRPYDCIKTSSGQTLIYGRNDQGTVSVIVQQNTTATNTEQTTERGSIVHIKSITHAVYEEATESGAAVAYLDLQYAQATTYSGADGSLLSRADNVVFKSRSRMTGRAVLNSSGDVSSGLGEFVVTKYDASPSLTTAVVTQAKGRGNFASEKKSLFALNSNSSGLPGSAQTFCVQASSTLPSLASSVDCSPFEFDFAWKGHSFPFTPSPALAENFESMAFFKGDNVDLIADDGNNFSIPTY